MADFRRLTDRISVSPQITPQEVAEAAAQGFALIVNNRPDGEETGQPSGESVEAAARAHGLRYIAIPVGHEGLGEDQITAMKDALADAEGKTLAFCRSGTRSTYLWALAEAARGEKPALLRAHAVDAGYDLSPIAPTLDVIATRAHG
ncbi:hypothetical protein AAW01_09055 [Aurantiacibacter gangjinensis]|uniref:Beta-lactamase hydrolase-like protein phosphatase-like domain-containing protein n=2 Tax=Aurantiacibacter gangjinensis TaxID=502682 RepID=A0A0G9MND4_9SPHN|nr:TIGR01244 family sulfur transferase [Aurantiacibacter gangjinensis]KLE32222.1 hypothetical protein AAW01_09055 [Aurantiacibacter gangjinensis]